MSLLFAALIYLYSSVARASLCLSSFSVCHLCPLCIVLLHLHPPFYVIVCLLPVFIMRCQFLYAASISKSRCLLFFTLVVVFCLFSWVRSVLLLKVFFFMPLIVVSSVIKNERFAQNAYFNQTESHLSHSTQTTWLVCGGDCLDGGVCSAPWGLG